MYSKDKSRRITLRLSDDQFNHVKNAADVLGVSPSDFLRMVINSTMYMTDKGNKIIDDLERNRGGQGRENDKADQHNFV